MQELCCRVLWSEEGYTGSYVDCAMNGSMQVEAAGWIGNRADSRGWRKDVLVVLGLHEGFAVSRSGTYGRWTALPLEEERVSHSVGPCHLKRDA
ncbi:hypothetical protein CBR_g19329 [Chara braunii]|uniref:Uncharacterized protein n=1 Tax=Chara braunii TaxID=69332 RepID=A0A388KXN7_CHABU|nr:hypothetical protein CBR_g19329 [Chara braunii]|eukprot:GBG74817.1 hypothetical protein CBR_g19329 [Chara braunii]